MAGAEATATPSFIDVRRERACETSVYVNSTIVKAELFLKCHSIACLMSVGTGLCCFQGLFSNEHFYLFSFSRALNSFETRL